MEKTALLLNESFETMPWDAVDTVVFDIGNVLLEDLGIIVEFDRLEEGD